MPFAIELERDFFEPMRTIIAENPPNKDGLLEAKKAELRRQYAIWLPASRDDAFAVNFQAKVNIINNFLEIPGREQPITFIDFNSTFGKEGKGPGFYGNVLLKRYFSDWLEEHADELAASGIDTAEFIAAVVGDTDVGKYLLTKVAPILQPEQATVMIRTQVRMIDVFRTMRGFLEMSPDERAIEGRPYERYIVGNNGVTSVIKSIPAELKIDPDKFDI
jgi:hypothetical protein